MNETSYYITRPGGTPTGPYTLDSLEQMAADGKLEPDFLYCVEGMPEWLQITRIVDLPGTSSPLPPLPTVPTVPAPEQTIPTQSAPAGEKPNVRFTSGCILMVLSLIMFPLTLLFAIVVLIQSGRADRAWFAGDVQESRRLADSAELWVRISWITIAVQIIAVVAMAIYAGSVLYPRFEQELRELPSDNYELYLR